MYVHFHKLRMFLFNDPPTTEIDTDCHRLSLHVALPIIGLDARLRALAAAAPDRADELTGQHGRLVDPAAMGDLFKVMAIHASGWPHPEGFAEPKGSA